MSDSTEMCSYERNQKMSVDLGRPFPPAIQSDAPLEERYVHLSEQVDILAAWILNNMPEEIRDEGACETALRLLRELYEMRRYGYRLPPEAPTGEESEN